MNVTVPNTLSCPMWYEVQEVVAGETKPARWVSSLTPLYDREDNDPRYTFSILSVESDQGYQLVQEDEEVAVRTENRLVATVSATGTIGASSWTQHRYEYADVIVAHEDRSDEVTPDVSSNTNNYRDVEPVGTVTLDEYRKGNVRSHLPASTYKKETQADLSERFRKERVALEKSERWWAMLSTLRSVDPMRKDAEELFQVERQRRAHRRWLNIYTSTYMGRTMHRVGPMVMDANEYGHVYCPICKKFDLRWESHPDVIATASLSNSNDPYLNAYYNILKRDLQERFTIKVIEHFMAHAQMESDPSYEGRRYTPQSQQTVTV